MLGEGRYGMLKEGREGMGAPRQQGKGGGAACLQQGGDSMSTAGHWMTGVARVHHIPMCSNTHSTDSKSKHIIIITVLPRSSNGLLPPPSSSSAYPSPKFLVQSEHPLPTPLAVAVPTLPRGAVPTHIACLVQAETPVVARVESHAGGHTVVITTVNADAGEDGQQHRHDAGVEEEQAWGGG